LRKFYSEFFLPKNGGCGWFRRSGFGKLGKVGSFEKGRFLLFKLRGGTVNCEQLDLMGFDLTFSKGQIAAGSEGSLALRFAWQRCVGSHEGFVESNYLTS